VPFPTVSNALTGAVVLLDLFAIGRAVVRGRGVESTLAWIFAILAFPILGALSYVTLANPSIRRATRRRRLSRAAMHLQLVRRVPSADGRDPGGGLPLLELTAALTGLTPSSGNEVGLLAEDARAFERIEGALREARRSIWAEYFIIRNDETGHRFLDLLARRAAAGVEVHLLYDAVGSLRADSRRLRAIQAAGGQAEMFLPVNPLRRRWAVHLRNHRKLVVVDGETGFTGGMNVGDEYSGRARNKGAQYFHDTHLQVRGPAVLDLARTFAEDWRFATGVDLTVAHMPSPPRGGTSIVAVVPSGPDQAQNAHALVTFAGVATARRRCYLSSPYFIPDEPLVRALVTAALRGVDVRLLVPERSDVWLISAAARSYFPMLLRGGVRIFTYLPSMLHAKRLVVDGEWALVGSGNADIRSFRLNFELGALVVDPSLAAALEEGFTADLAQSREVSAAELERRGWPGRLRDGAARLLSPLL
jgi:cardiolipin synthase